MRTLPRVVCLVLAAALSLAVVPASPAAAAPFVDPSTVGLALAAGQSSSLSTTVTTPDVGPAPDIVFLADTTGSMRPALANVSQNIRSMVDTLQASQPDARFAVAEYKEQRNQRAFYVNTPLTREDDAVAYGVDDWLIHVGGGGAPWTDFVNAFWRIGTDAVSFRPNGTRIVAWFGDARSHDPSLGHSLTDATNALRAAGVQVVAVPLDGTTGGGLDALGQASSITAATNGILMPGTAPNLVAQALLDGIRALTQRVTPTVVTCDSGLTVSYDPATHSVRSGTSATFTTTVRVAPTTAPGTYRCLVDHLVNGTSAGLTQTFTVDVSAGSALSVGNASVVEGDAGTTNAVFRVGLDRPAPMPVTVSYTTADETASSPADYAASSGEVTIPAGVSSVTFGVPVVGDTEVETDESFTVALSDPVGAVIADGTGVGTIVNDDEELPPVALSVGDASATEGGAATFSVTLDRPAGAPVSVRYATANGTAVAPGDFASASGELAFATGESTKHVTVPTVADGVDEPAETFTLTLSDASGATIADGSGVGTIADDDPDGGFACRASALTVVANPPFAPCVTDDRQSAGLDVNLGLLRIRAATPRATTQSDVGKASASAQVATTRITALGLSVELGAVTATASASCRPTPAGPAPAFTGSSSIGAVKVNGIAIPVGDRHVTVPLLVGTLELNRTITTATGVTQRAVELRSLLGNVVLGEARAGVTGTPAHPNGNPCVS